MKPTVDMRYRTGVAATVIIALAVAGLTLTPVTAPEIVGENSDKLYHLIAFAALTFPSAFLHRRLSRSVLIFAVLFGAIIEIIQPRVGRSGSWEDLLADLAGAFLGLAVGRILGGYFLPPMNGQQQQG